MMKYLILASIIAISLIGIIGVHNVDAVPPLHSLGVTDITVIGENDSINVDEQTRINVDYILETYRPIEFALLFQITDDNGQVVMLNWVAGFEDANMDSDGYVCGDSICRDREGQEKTMTTSWTPLKSGEYQITLFAWKSIDNPSALGPPFSRDITVEPNATLELKQCKDNRVLVLRVDGSSSCVTKSTAEKLIQRGWKIIKTFDILTTSKVIELNLASSVEFVADGREIQRSILQKSPAPFPMHDRIMDSMGDGVSVSSTGVASITSTIHEKYSVNTGIGFYAEDWMPEYIPDGQKLLYTETTCYEKTGDCGLGIHFVSTTFVLHENATSHDLQVSKGFMISVKYSTLPLDETEDITEQLKESRESQSGNYGRFIEMIRDGKTVSGYEGGNDYNHYHASLYFQPDEHMGIGVHSNYHSLDELIPIFESVMK